LSTRDIDNRFKKMSTYTVRSIDDIEFRDIRICNLCRSSTKDIFEITYKGNNNVLITSTTLVVPWNKSYSNDETSFNIELNEYVKIRKGTKEDGFLCKLSKLIDVLKQLMENNKVFKNKYRTADMSFTSGVKEHQNNAKSIRFFNVRKTDITIFNQHKQVIDINEITQNDNVKCLLVLENCWMKENAYGVNIRLLQILRESPLRVIQCRRQCLIAHDDIYDDHMTMNYNNHERTTVLPNRNKANRTPPEPPPLPKQTQSNVSKQNKIFRPSILDLKSAKSLLKKVQS